MPRPVLVVIQGAPGVGKTTLLRRLKKDVAFPALGKDDIKEFLFDTIEQSNKDFARIQGGVSFEMLYSFARTFLENDLSVMIEGAFFAGISDKKIKAILDEMDVRCVELFCHVDEETRRRRFESRVADGTRHAGHLDGQSVHDPLTIKRYSPLNIGEYVDIDTSAPISDETYATILAAIHSKQEENV